MIALKTKRFVFSIYFVFIAALFSLSGICLYSFWGHYAQLKETQNTSIIEMEKTYNPEKKVISLSCLVNMTSAKWKYHRGVPCVIIDAKDQLLFRELRDSIITFIMVSRNGNQIEELNLSGKDIRNTRDWEQSRLKISSNSGVINAIINKQETQDEIINYKRGVNKINLIIRHTNKKMFENISAYVFFRKTEETTIPFIYLVPGVFLGLLAILSTISYHSSYRKLNLRELRDGCGNAGTDA